MPAVVLADNAYGTLNAAIATTDSAITLTSGHGARFPVVVSTGSGAAPLYACLINSGNILEEIKITAHIASSDTVIIARAVGSTTAKAWNAGDRIESRVSKSVLIAIAKIEPDIRDPAYGALCDGVNDDTAAINACLAANPNGTIHIGGTPLISSTITVSGRQRIVFEGGPDSGITSPPASYLKKKSTMTTVALLLRGGAVIEYGGVDCSTGATGGAIQIAGNTAGCRYVTVYGFPGTPSGVGFRVGDDLGTNSNSWFLDHCNASSMSSHGFYFHDGSGGAANANAGTALQCQAISNAGDGFRSNNAKFNVLNQCLAESNTGYGARIMASSGDTVFYGDYELNTAGQVIYEAGTNQLAFFGNIFQPFTDNGYFTKNYINYNGAYRTFTPALVGTTGATKTGTAVSVTGTTMTVTSVAHGYANGETVYISGFVANANADGAFVIFNVSANAFDVTVRTDGNKDAPSSASGLSLVLQSCGVYSLQVGRYLFDRSDVVFSFRLTSSSVTNITGNVQFLLPYATAGITNYQTVQEIGYYSGITHTGKIMLAVNHTGLKLASIFKSIGSGLTPANLAATDIASATDMLITGRYTWRDELA